MRTASELSYLAVPNNFLASGKNKLAQANFKHGTSRSRILRSAVVLHCVVRLPLVELKKNDVLQSNRSDYQRRPIRRKHCFTSSRPFLSADLSLSDIPINNIASV